MYYVGIDVSKLNVKVCIINESGETIKDPVTYDLSRGGIFKLIDALSKIDDKTKILIGMEATGSLWENILTSLSDEGYNVVLLNPHQTCKYRELQRRKAKTDAIDALVISGLLRSGEYKRSYISSELIQSLRDLARLQNSLEKTLKDYKRRAFSLLNVVFPEYTQIVKDPFAKTSCLILKRFPTALDLSRVSPKHVEKIVRSVQGANFDLAFTKKLINLAKDSIYSGKSQKARSLSLSIIISEIENLKEHIKQLDDEISSILKPPDSPGPYDNLLEIVGIGPKTIARFIQDVGDLSRFNSAKDLIGFLGLYPRISESGKYKDPHPKMSNRGPRIARASLYMAAVASIRHNIYFKELYHKKLSQGKAPKQALIVVARKIATMFYSIFKYNQKFSWGRLYSNHKKVSNLIKITLTA